MSLFGKKGESVAVIDVRSSSIGAGYARLTEGAAPAYIYGTRTPLEPHATEPLAEALVRTLDATLHALATDGAAALRSATGQGKADRVFVTFTSPWQRSRVYSRTIEKDKPFVFTHQVFNEAAAQNGEDEKGFVRANEMMLATLLNGYEVANPFNKRVTRAELILLSAAVEGTMRTLVEKAARKALHQHRIDFNAFLPEAYVVFRDLYPHQRDFLVFDIGSESSDILMVKHGLLVAAVSIPQGVASLARAARSAGVSSPAVPMASADPLIDSSRNTSFAAGVENAKAEWLGGMRASLAEVAKQEPLPRTVFMLAEEGVRDFLKNLLDSPELRSLWLTDESLSIIPVLPVQFTTFVTAPEGETVDPALATLMLAAGKRQ